MELSLLLNLIDKIGADKIFGFVFELGDRILYKGENKFDKSHIDEESQTLKYVTEDANGIPVITYHPISRIHHIFTVENAEDVDKVSRRYLIG